MNNVLTAIMFCLGFDVLVVVPILLGVLSVVSPIMAFNLTAFGAIVLYRAVTRTYA